MMLTHLNEYPTITITFRDSDWDRDQVTQCLSDLVASMELVASQGHMFELMIEGSVEMMNNKSPSPPFYVFVAVIAALVKNRSLLKKSLLCTALFMPSQSLQTMVKYVLSVYHPTRPLKQFDNLDSARKFILDSRQAGLDAYAKQHADLSSSKLSSPDLSSDSSSESSSESSSDSSSDSPESSSELSESSYPQLDNVEDFNEYMLEHERTCLDLLSLHDTESS